jgi:DNA-binding NtrC family response regulator
MLVRWLAEWAERIVTAGSVRGALRSLAKERPDLIVLDLGLTDGRGTDVAAAAAAAAAAPFPMMIVLSGTASPAEAFELSGLGIAAFLQKPIAQADFDECLATLPGPLDRVEIAVARALGTASFHDVQRHVSEALVQAALNRSEGNKSAAARLLNTTRQTIRQRVHGSSDEDEA